MAAKTRQSSGAEVCPSIRKRACSEYGIWEESPHTSQNLRSGLASQIAG
jgi:hypothetical protein